jgi:phosphoserine phosphatase RsbU/P
LGAFAAARDISALKELEVQRSIAETLQQALLSVPAQVPGLSFGHLHRSATEHAQVGGDFYDLFLLPDYELGIILGDVSGRGIEAANLAALVKNTVKAYAHWQGTPAQVLADTNHLLLQSSGEERFVTAFFGRLNLKTGELEFSSAGHPPPALRTAKGEVRLLEQVGRALGILPDATFPDAQARLAPGDLLLLYTDGLTEARRDGQMFGERRLMKYLATQDGVPTAEVPAGLLQEALAFTGGPLKDDLAILALELLRE